MRSILIGLFVFSLILGAGVILTATPGTDAAYAEAEARIKAAAEDNAAVLRFDGLENLGTLPPEIANLSELIQIDLRDTAIKDLTPLSDLQNLRTLSLHGTLVEDLSPLSNLQSLDNLNMSQTWVRDLDPLVALPALRRLDIGDTWTATLEPTTRMPALDWINMHGAFSSDGSRVHYDALQTKGVTENNGRAFQENYQPGYMFLAKLRLDRLMRRVRLGLNALN